MSSSNPFNFNEGKIQASILLKHLRSSDKLLVNQAIMRIRQQDFFSQLSDEELLSNFKLKHCLEIIALENQYQSWRDFKKNFDKSIEDDFVEHYIGGFLNHWFPNYQEAKEFQRLRGGFLLPFKSQYFICEADFIEVIGLDSGDQLWREIDFDWVKPMSKKSWKILRKRLSKLKNKPSNG